jgi:hypothetical protein
VRHCLEEMELWVFYMALNTKRGKGRGKSDKGFGKVEWGKHAATLNCKPDMYCIWLSKRSSGMCATILCVWGQEILFSFIFLVCSF